MSEFLNYAGKRFVDYWTRVRTIPRLLLWSALAIAIPSVGWQFSLNLQNRDSSVTLSSSDAGASDIAFWGLTLASLLFAIGIGWSIVDQVIAHRRESKRTTIVIESRGLRDDDGVSLAATVRKTAKGNIDELVLDVRRFSRDGHVFDPQGAANKIMRLSSDIRFRRELKGRDETFLVYGGLTSVPFTFLIGVLLDDEGEMTSYDWDRTKEQWRQLDATDDGNRFKKTWQAPTLPFDTAVLAISCSYPVLNDNLALSFPGVPVMRLDLEGETKESHWSSAKQRALALEVLEAATELEGHGVKTVHVVVAAANSLVMARI